MAGRLWEILQLALLTIVFWYACMLILAVQHEAVHVQINAKYGIPSTVHYNYFALDGTFAYTQPDSLSMYRSNCNDFCKLAHNNNEVFGYHVLALVTIAIALLFLLALLISIGFFKAAEVVAEEVEEMHHQNR